VKRSTIATSDSRAPQVHSLRSSSRPSSTANPDTASTPVQDARPPPLSPAFSFYNGYRLRFKLPLTLLSLITFRSLYGHHRYLCVYINSPSRSLGRVAFSWNSTLCACPLILRDSIFFLAAAAAPNRRWSLIFLFSRSFTFFPLSPSCRSQSAVSS
jgi:hypothetical protein